MNVQEPDARLESWKEIGAYLQRDARTARRWEIEEGLPVHRHSHKSRSSVYAYPSEIDAWRAGRRVIPAADPAPLTPAWWRPAAFGVTTLLCLVMVGSGIRPAEAAGPATKQNRQIWASAVEDFSESVPSPDGRYVAFTDWNTGDLGIRDLRAGQSRRLTNNGEWQKSGTYDYAESPVVSPNNRQIAYTWWIDKDRRTELRVMPANGGVARTFLRVEGGYYKLFGWSPDGQYVLAVRRVGECQVALISVQDGSVHAVKSFDRRDLSLNASMSPDGRFIAYDFPQSPNMGARDVFVVPAGGGEAFELQHPANDWAPLWAADGSRILFLSDRTGDPSLWSIEVENGRPKGDAELVKTGMGKTRLLGVTRTGALQYVVPGTSSPNIYRADLGGDLKALGQPVRAAERFVNSNLGPQVSADGKLLAYVSLRAGGAVIVIRDLGTNEEREIKPRTLQVVRGYGPMWFPDDRSLLVVARDSQGPGFFRLDVDSGNEELLQRFVDAVDCYNLAPDGKALLFADRSGGPATGRLVRFALDTRKETELNKGQWTLSVSVSPDSRQVAYLRAEPTGPVTHLMVMPAEGGEAREVFQDPKWDGNARFNGLSWTPDQKFLIFVRDGGTPQNPQQTLWRVPVSGGQPEELGISVKGRIDSPQVLPDKKRILYSAIETNPSEVWALENYLPKAAGKTK